MTIKIEEKTFYARIKKNGMSKKDVTILLRDGVSHFLSQNYDLNIPIVVGKIEAAEINGIPVYRASGKMLIHPDYHKQYQETKRKIMEAVPKALGDKHLAFSVE